MAKGSSLGKDPAVSWVFNDWQGGTMTLSRFQKGCYMDLLTAQFNTGHLTLEEIKTVLGNDFAVWGVLSKKFKEDSAGNFYNERLEFEIVKRKKFTKSRRDNLNGETNDGDLSPHMGNGKGIEIRKENFKKDIDSFKDKFSEKILTEFFSYWTELNKTKTKMRFELEDVFEASKRLATWSRNDNKFSNGNTNTKGW